MLKFGFLVYLKLWLVWFGVNFVILVILCFVRVGVDVYFLVIVGRKDEFVID